MEQRIEINGENLREEAQREVRQYSPLTLAFMGDAVYEREIREYVVRSGNTTPAKLNRKSSALAKASTQSEMARLLEEDLTEEEKEILRRGRNAHPRTMAKNASMSDYRAATGLEALFGYLYLSGREERAKELFLLGLSRLPEEYFRKDTNG